MTENDPGHAVYYGLMRCLYEKCAVRDSIVGTVDSIARITPEILTDCHRAFYAPSNMLLCVVGDVDPERGPGRAPYPARRARAGTGAGLRPCRGSCALCNALFAGYGRLRASVMMGASCRRRARVRSCLESSSWARLRCAVWLACPSPLYTGMYAEGLVRSFWNELDWGPCAAYAVLGGEGPEPERVLERLSGAVARVVENGFDKDAFERCRRAEYGMRVRMLERAPVLADMLARSSFAGSDCLRAFELLPQLDADECACFVSKYLSPERLALAVVQPKPRKDM